MVTELLPIMSIHRVHIQEPIEEEIKKYVDSYSNCSKKKPGKKYEYREVKNADPNNTQMHNFKLLIFSSKKEEKDDRMIATIVATLTESDKEMFMTSTRVDFVFFLYRKEDIYALTTANAYHVVKKITDYSFPRKTAKRLVDPKGFGVTIEMPTGNLRAAQKYHREAAFFSSHSIELIREINSTFKENCSLYGISCLSAPKTEEKIPFNPIAVEVKLGLIRIKKRFSILQMTEVLDHFSKIYSNERLLNLNGEIEKDSESFKVLDNVQLVAKNEKTKLNKQLHENLFYFIKNDRKNTLYLYHKYYEDFIKSTQFKLMRNKNDCIKTWNSIPSIDDFKLALLDQPVINMISYDKFFKSLKTIKISYIRKGKIELFPIKEFVEGEVFLNKRNYFCLGGVWYSLSVEYFAEIHASFARLIKEHLLFADHEAYLNEKWLPNCKEPQVDTPYDYAKKYMNLGRYIVSCPSIKQGIKLFDLMLSIKDKTYLYIIKSGFNNFRKIHSEMSHSAQYLYIARNAKNLYESSNIVTNFYDETIKYDGDDDNKRELRNKIQTLSKSKEDFCDLFRQEIHFVAAILDTEDQERSLEREGEVKTSLDEQDFEKEGIVNSQQVIKECKNSGLLNENNILTDDYYVEGKRKFPNNDDIFSIFQKNCRPQMHSVIEKSDLLSTKEFICALGFSFHITQILRPSDESIEKRSTDLKTKKRCTGFGIKNISTSAEGDDSSFFQSSSESSEKFLRGQGYTRVAPTMGDGACAIHALLGTMIGEGSNQQYVFLPKERTTDIQKDAKNHFINVFKTAIEKREFQELLIGCLDDYFIQKNSAYKELTNSLNLSLSQITKEKQQFYSGLLQKAKVSEALIQILRSGQKGTSKENEWNLLQDSDLLNLLRQDPKECFNAFDAVSSSIIEKLDAEERAHFETIQQSAKKIEDSCGETKKRYLFEHVSKYYETVVAPSYYLTDNELELAAYLFNKPLLLISKEGSRPLGPSQKDRVLIYHEPNHYSRLEFSGEEICIKSK